MCDSSLIPFLRALCTSVQLAYPCNQSSHPCSHRLHLHECPHKKGIIPVSVHRHGVKSRISLNPTLEKHGSSFVGPIRHSWARELSPSNHLARNLDPAQCHALVLRAHCAAFHGTVLCPVFHPHGMAPMPWHTHDVGPTIVSSFCLIYLPRVEARV